MARVMLMAELLSLSGVKPQKDVYMKVSLSALGALAALALSSGSSVRAQTTTAIASPTPAPPPIAARPASADRVKDDANESPRERGRILVKRNPIASEYQIFGDVGSSPGADADGEGVDYRAFFSAQNPTALARDQFSIGYSINYNAASKSVKQGGDVGFAYRFGDDQRWAVSGQFRSSGSERFIDHYESVWQETPQFGSDGDSAFLLDRPRYSYDDISTRNNTGALAIGYKLTPKHSVYLKLSYQDYFDNAYRNRLEYTFGGTSIDSETIVMEGENIVAASTPNGRTRRYFGDTDNFRERLHTTFGGSYAGDTWNIDYSFYTQKWDLDTLWYDWNFNDFGLDLTYAIEDPNLPVVSVGDGIDILDTSSARFTSLRIHDTFTQDRDRAGRIDADRTLFLGEQALWLQTGFQLREKERSTGEARAVYVFNNEDPLYLADIDFGKAPLSILDGRYTLQDGLDPDAGRERLLSHPGQFAFDSFKSHTESEPQSYDAKEKVVSAYALVAADFERWKLEVGLRAERTETETRGRVLLPAAVNDPNEGELIETLSDPRTGEGYVIKDLYAQNDYMNALPTIEGTYEFDDRNKVRASVFQLLMRPQYSNIVDFRRVSIPTRGISEGNPELEPTKVSKARLAWIHQFEDKSSLSVEAYAISISNFFYGAVSTETIIEDGAPTLYRASRVENGDSGRIYGAELQWSKNIERLAILEKANLSVAYTYSDSEAKVSTRPADIITVPERSKHLLKATLRGSIGKLTTSFELAYQSRALDNVGVSAAQDDYRENVIATEVGARYPITQNTSVYANLFNLTDHPERSYEGSSLRVSQSQYSSWFGIFGVRRQF